MVPGLNPGVGNHRGFESLPFRHGDVSEWFKVPVSKTGVCHSTGGSNPSISATQV